MSFARSGERPFREALPFLLVLLAVLVPTGIVVWLMTDAVSKQVASSREAVNEAYRRQLQLLRPRVDDVAKAAAAGLQLKGTAAAAMRTNQQHFESLVRTGGVDGLVLFNSDGHVVFPTLASDNRVALADLRLFNLQQMPRENRAGRATLAAALSSMLNDFTEPMPAGQRLFLMAEVKRIQPDAELPVEPVLRLSMRAVEAGVVPGNSAGFWYTQIPNTWALSTQSQKVLALYTTARLKALVETTLTPHMPSGVRLVAHAPGTAAPDVGIGTGSTLPGWMVSIAVDDQTSTAAAAHTRLLVRSWVGLLSIGLLGYVGVLAIQRLRRQVRVAGLKTDLTAAVSHELRAPLASVQVLVDGLLADKELDPVKTREYLTLIAGEQKRLSRVIENFLSFARIERGEKRFDLVPTDPGEVVSRSVSAVHDRMPLGTNLRVEVAKHLPRVKADPEALERAVINLLDNAIKFTPDDKQIVVRAMADRGDVLLSVSDNGPGIPTGEQRRIFERFYRTDQRLARETAGVGLGLSIVSLIMRGHGGVVDVTSAPGAGSTFTLRLPAITEPIA